MKAAAKQRKVHKERMDAQKVKEEETKESLAKIVDWFIATMQEHEKTYGPKSSTFSIIGNRTKKYKFSLEVNTKADGTKVDVLALQEVPSNAKIPNVGDTQAFDSAMKLMANMKLALETPKLYFLSITGEEIKAAAVGIEGIGHVKKTIPPKPMTFSSSQQPTNTV
jgi:uncharacterized membrane protein YfhO